MDEAVYSPPITLESVLADRLEDVEDNPEAVLFRVRLSQMPGEIWTQEFEHAYRSTPYGIKPPLQIVGDTLEIVYLPRYSDELPGFFRFLVVTARTANKETHITEEIHAAGMRDRHKVEFQNALRAIKL